MKQISYYQLQYNSSYQAFENEAHQLTFRALAPEIVPFEFVDQPTLQALSETIEQEGIPFSGMAQIMSKNALSSAANAELGVFDATFQLINTAKSFFENGLDSDLETIIPKARIIGDSYTSGGDAATSYNIEIHFSDNVDQHYKQAFANTADWLSEIIISDIPDFYGVDDIVVYVDIIPFDGIDGTLGAAGPTYVRPASFLPYEAIIEMDSADAELIYKDGNWENLVKHEFMHALGFGVLWEYNDLLTYSDEAGYRYTGTNAVSAYYEDFPDVVDQDPYFYLGIPVETYGGTATAGSHWDETYFSNELMTGYLDNSNTMSNMSLASLTDIGYEIAV